MDMVKKFARWALATSEVARSQEATDEMQRKVDVLTETLQKVVDIMEKPEEPSPSGSRQKKESTTKRCT